MRILIGLCVALTALYAQAGKAKKEVQGIKTPGIQIPIAHLKPEAEWPLAPRFIIFSDSVLIPNKAGALERLDAKTNQLGEMVAGTNRLCGGAVTAFASLWIPSCEGDALLRFDPKFAASTVKIDSGVGAASPAVAANTDSVWILSDDKTTLSRIDPDQNKIVGQLRLPAGCNSLIFGETALWSTCPPENRVLRINPETMLVDKRIETSPQPSALVTGESSIWVLCLKEGKIERIDPKTDKVVKTIETDVTGAASGGIAFGHGFVWVTLPGFPISRIDPTSEKVAQQFWGPGGGAIQFGQGSVWLSNLLEGTLWRIDPKRIIATLVE